jgi:DNA-binding IclR family transcriptional regulator
MPHEERRRLAEAGFERYTKRTLVDFDALEKEAERVRRQGWAITKGSRTEGGVAIAVPLSDPGDDGEIAALGLFGPQLRCSTNAARDHWLRALLQTAESIQTAMTSFR